MILFKLNYLFIYLILLLKFVEKEYYENKQVLKFLDEIHFKNTEIYTFL